jgi:hypothetical protein
MMVIRVSGGCGRGNISTLRLQNNDLHRSGGGGGGLEVAVIMRVDNIEHFILWRAQ